MRGLLRYTDEGDRSDDQQARLHGVSQTQESSIHHLGGLLAAPLLFFSSVSEVVKALGFAWREMVENCRAVGSRDDSFSSESRGTPEKKLPFHHRGKKKRLTTGDV